MVLSGKTRTDRWRLEIFFPRVHRQESQPSSSSTVALNSLLNESCKVGVFVLIITVGKRLYRGGCSLRSNHPIICPEQSCFDEEDDYSGAIRMASPHPDAREAGLTG